MRKLWLSILTVIMCLSLSVGATFALFTSESDIDIAVSSGKVKITAQIDKNSVQTKKLYDTGYTQGDDNMYEGVATFTNEGLSLEFLVPGDGIMFNIVISNESSVTTKYRTIITCSEDNGLFSGLNVSIADREHYDGNKYLTNWQTLDAGSANIIIPVVIELPEGAGNEYQETSCKINYFVEAVQGNAETVNEFFASEKVVVNGASETTEGVNVGETGRANGYVPAGAKMEEGKNNLALSIEKTDDLMHGNVAFNKGEEVVAFNIHMDGLDNQNNNEVIIVTLNNYFEPGLSGVVMFHNNIQMTEVSAGGVDEHDEYYYNPANGDIVFGVKSFSNFTIVTGATDFMVPSADIRVLEESELPVSENLMVLEEMSYNGAYFPAIRDDIALEKAFKFTATQTVEELANSKYKNWLADFVIECDSDIAVGELGLAGQYEEAFGETWVTFGTPFALKAGDKLPMLTSVGLTFTYEMICDMVKEFNCGVFRAQNNASMAGKKITVSLALADYETVQSADIADYSEEAGTLKYVSSISYTFDVLPEGQVYGAFTTADEIYGEWGGNARESFEIKFFSNETYLGSTKLNNVGGIIDGDVYVTWHMKLDTSANTDEYWTQEWVQRPTTELLPTRAVLFIDGVNVGESAVQYNGPDNVNKIVAAVYDADGVIVKYFTDFMEAFNYAVFNGYNVIALDDVNLNDTLVNPAA